MVSSVYSYYLSTYGNKEVSRYDSHKKSDLQNIYNSMIRVNRKSPLYKIKNLTSAQKYAIDIKESAREFRNIASALTSDDGTIDAFSKKKAESTKSELVEAFYIDGDGEEKGFDIRVDCMAKGQTNIGKYMEEGDKSIPAGSYSFDLSIGKYTYEFAFDVPYDKTAKDVQKQVASLVNRSDIGITASVRENAVGETAIELVSAGIGVPEHSIDGKTFEVVTNDKSEAGNIVEMLGLHQVAGMPTDARFTIDGKEHTASTNSLRYQNFQLYLKGESATEGARVQLKPDFDAMMDNVGELVSAYNSMLDMAADHVDENKDSDRLLKEIKKVANVYKEELDSAGFMVMEDGHIKIESSLLIQSDKEGTLQSSLDRLNSFKKALVRTADNMSIDPMKYVNKKMIAYPNPVRSYTKPYISSIYSGMMYNGYV